MILKFNEFNKNNEVLNIFDFDDTIVRSPRFEEMAIEYLKENDSIKSILNKSIKLINKSFDDLKIEDGRIYVNDINKEINIKGNWVRKKNRVYLVAPDTFYFSDLSFPKYTKELSKLYKSVENKAIVTARFHSVREKVIDSLNRLGLEMPNYGLHCYPMRNVTTDNAGIWKGKKIVELIKESGFTNVKFYDDNSKWVRQVTKEVKKELPNINFEGIKVK